MNGVRDKCAAPWENQQSAYAETKTQISFAVTAKLISAFVFATRIVQILLYLTPKFQASSHLLLLCSPVCVRPVRKPHCWFSHEVAQMSSRAMVFMMIRISYPPGYSLFSSPDPKAIKVSLYDGTGAVVCPSVRACVCASVHTLKTIISATSHDWDGYCLH